VLGKLIQGRLTFSQDRDKRQYRFSGTATLGGILTGMIEGTIVPPPGECVPISQVMREEVNLVQAVG
jgi:hypothetical protein